MIFNPYFWNDHNGAGGGGGDDGSVSSSSSAVYVSVDRGRTVQWTLTLLVLVSNHFPTSKQIERHTEWDREWQTKTEMRQRSHDVWVLLKTRKTTSELVLWTCEDGDHWPVISMVVWSSRCQCVVGVLILLSSRVSTQTHCWLSNILETRLWCTLLGYERKLRGNAECQLII